jgi:hypothetical protein
MCFLREEFDSACYVLYEEEIQMASIPLAVKIQGTALFTRPDI